LRLGKKKLERQSTEYLCWSLSSEELLAEISDTDLIGTRSASLVVLVK